jgi:hypothetical protein
VSYRGFDIAIPLGRAGLMTDENQSDIPPSHLIRAKNVEISNGVISKEPGSRRWNKVPLGSGIVAMAEWAPNDAQRFLVVVERDGQVRRYANAEEVAEVVSDGTSPTALSVSDHVFIVEGGAESAGRAKKLFIFTGNDPVQVISGTGLTRSNMSAPPTDWATQYPTFGLIHRNRLVAFGNSSDSHRIYYSLDSDHEDFTSSSLQFSVFPGDGIRLFGGFVYKSRLFLGKQPRGLYWMEDSDVNTANWYVVKGSAEFGFASPNAAEQVRDDLLIKNSSGGVTSSSAVQAFGDIRSADLLDVLKIENFIQSQTSNMGTEDSVSLYDQYTKLLRFTYWGAGASQNNRVLTMQTSRESPAVSLSYKDQINTFSFRRELKVLKPFYGAEDGYVYELDRRNRDIELLSPPEKPVAALAGAGAGNVDDGKHYYAVSFYDDTNETEKGYLSLPLTVTDKTSDGQVSLSSIPVDLRGIATKRRLYRTEAGLTSFKLLATINDNVTTTYTDNTADANLGAAAPLVNTFNTAYEGEFMTPQLNFGFSDPRLSNKNKIFDFVEIEYYPTGNWNISMDSFIDSSFAETLSFPLYFGETLDGITVGTYRFLGATPRTIRKRLHGRGRTWAGRFYNSGRRENFNIVGLKIYFRLGNEDQKAFDK